MDLGHFNYTASILIVLFGLFTMMTANNLMRKAIGMVLLQTGVILFYVTVSFKSDAAIPILHHSMEHHIIDTTHYANPLPHALMLTAIVVGVSTLGVALVLMTSIYRSYKTLEEDEILEKMENRP